MLNLQIVIVNWQVSKGDTGYTNTLLRGPSGTS
jgi:hypothetical protein